MSQGQKPIPTSNKHDKLEDAMDVDTAQASASTAGQDPSNSFYQAMLSSLPPVDVKLRRPPFERLADLKNKNNREQGI